MRKQYVFGPVSSRRLGISLGVDVIHGRRCPLDCIYCEAGKTDDLTCKRSDYVPIDQVKTELQEVLAENPALDYITFSGAGEPTLNSSIGELSRWIKSNYPQYKLCLLTNGTLLDDPAVRSVLEYIDLAMPNFDASTEEELAIINRPAPGVTLESLAAGIRKAAAEYPGKLVLELFVVPQVNDSDSSIARFAEYIKSFKGLKSVQLNTLDRPGVVDWIHPAPPETILRFIHVLEKIIPVEAIGRFRYRSKALQEVLPQGDFYSSILAQISKQPATAEELSEILQESLQVIQERADKLVDCGLLCSEKRGKQIFYLRTESDIS